MEPHTKATEQYFPVVLFIMLYKVVLTFEFVGEILVWPFKWNLLSSTFQWCWFYLSSLWTKFSMTIQTDETHEQ